LATPSFTFSGSRLNSTRLEVLTLSSPSLPPNFCFESAAFDAVTTADTHCPALKSDGNPGNEDFALDSSSSSSSSDSSDSDSDSSPAASSRFVNSGERLVMGMWARS